MLAAALEYLMWGGIGIFLVCGVLMYIGSAAILAKLTWRFITGKYR